MSATKQTRINVTVWKKTKHPRLFFLCASSGLRGCGLITFDWLCWQHKQTTPQMSSDRDSKMANLTSPTSNQWEEHIQNHKCRKSLFTLAERRVCSCRRPSLRVFRGVEFTADWLYVLGLREDERGQRSGLESGACPHTDQTRSIYGKRESERENY